MRCPWCAHDEDRVVDSRAADGGASIRRRRHCGNCGRRFTTYERLEEVGIVVVKRDGHKEPFDRAKVAAGVGKAIKNRPVTAEQVESLARDVEDELRKKGPVVTSQEVGLATLSALRSLDDVAYLRFASVYKDFQELTDFERELGLLQKKIPPKQKAGATNDSG